MLRGGDMLRGRGHVQRGQVVREGTCEKFLCGYT